MGTTTIDVIQSAQITALQDDVVELKDKLNAAVGELNKAVTDIADLRTQEVNTISDISNIRSEVVKTVAEITSLVTATNTLKSNVENINTRITNNYVGGGGSRPNTSPADGILKRLADAEGDITALQSTSTSSVAQPFNINTTTQSTVSSQSQTSSTPSAQSSSNPAAQTSANAASASVTGVYSATGTKVVTIQDNSATRAREVARSTLTRLRDI